MNISIRGLLALTITFVLQTQLLAEYLYKDEVVNRPELKEDVDKFGHELYEKTGIALKLVMIKKLPTGKNMQEYENEVLTQFSEPTILLTFSELDKEVDIMANEPSLYKYFNKKQVLSPVNSPVQAFIMAVTYADSFEHFNQMRKNYGGTILPLLGSKAKDDEITNKYAGAMLNGYIDLVHQIATAKGVTLENDPGNTNQNVMLIVKTVFYGFLLYAIIMYIKRLIYRRKHKNEK